MSNLVDNYYQSTRVSDAKLLKRGQFCWAPGYYLPASITTLELVDYDPKDERRNRYAVLTKPPENLLFNHTPVHELHLEHDEELLVIKAKRRLFLVISQAPIPWMAAGNRLRESGFICLPLYSFQPTDSPEFRERVKALEYPWWLYMPEDKTYRMTSGFARLDRLQVIAKELIQPIQVALTDDALFLVSEWLRYYLTEEIESIFMEDRQRMMQELSVTS